MGRQRKESQTREIKTLERDLKEIHIGRLPDGMFSDEDAH